MPLFTLEKSTETALDKDKNQFSFMSVFIEDKTITCTNTEPPLTVNNLERSGHGTGSTPFCCRSDSHSGEKKGSFEARTGCTAAPVCQQCSPAAEQEEGQHHVRHNHTHQNTARLSSGCKNKTSDSTSSGD